MKKDAVVISHLITSELIPSEGQFKVTSDLIDAFHSAYHGLFGKAGGNTKRSNLQYAKRLAGLSLVKLNAERAETILKPSKRRDNSGSGFVYIISNPAFANCFKIGFTKDLVARLTSYQMYDPNRNFVVEHYRFCEDAKQTEQLILSKFAVDILKGEWINKQDANSILASIEDIGIGVAR